MSTLVWSDDLALGIEQMDQTHVEFVELRNAVEAATDEQLLQRWKDLIDHTQIHFDNEDKWMRDTNFAASNCHTTHHKAVLDVMREGLNYGLKGHFVVVRKMNAELATWFPQHADTMDAALSDYLKRIGYDTVTGHIAHPEAMPGGQIHGCSGNTDTDLVATEPAEAASSCGH